MMMSSISTSSYGMGQMSGMGSRPSPAQMFSNIDEDDSGGLDKTEFSDLAEKMSQMTGEDVDAEALFADYDEDGDGELSEEETQAFMDDNRPEGPPPGGMGGMQGPPPPPDESQLFSDADEDEDGGLNATEAQGIADMISNATGEEMTVDDLMTEYDEDGDGSLNEEETLAALEANRPEGPPPPPEAGADESGSASWAQTSNIENYMMMASLGGNQDEGYGITAALGGSTITSSNALLSVNTMA